MKIDIKGEGIVDRVTEFYVTLTAIPDEGWMFRSWVIGERTETENPIIVQDEDAIILVTFYVPIEEYLRGLVGFDVPKTTLTAIRLSRGIEKNADVDSLSERTKELAYADLLMWGATNPSSYTGAKDSDGGWSHTDESKTISVADKKRFEVIANEIYMKYGDGKYNADFKIVNLW